MKAGMEEGGMFDNIGWWMRDLSVENEGGLGMRVKICVF
jgi:hypothetical protein